MYNPKTLVAFSEAIECGTPYDFIGDNLRDMNEDTIREIIFTLMDAMSDEAMDTVANELYDDNIADCYEN